MSAGSCGVTAGDGKKTFMWTDPNETYLLGRVPDNVLDILRVRVHNCNTFILVFFIHCRDRQTETWSSLETGNGADQYVQFRRSLTQTFPNPDALVSATCG